MMDFVNAVGGIDLDLSTDEFRVMNGYIRHHQLLGNAGGTDILSESDTGTLQVKDSQDLTYSHICTHLVEG